MTKRPDKPGDQVPENPRPSPDKARDPKPARQTPAPAPSRDQPAPGDKIDEVVHGEGDHGLDGFK